MNTTNAVKLELLWLLIPWYYDAYTTESFFIPKNDAPYW